MLLNITSNGFSGFSIDNPADVGLARIKHVGYFLLDKVSRLPQCLDSNMCFFVKTYGQFFLAFRNGNKVLALLRVFGLKPALSSENPANVGSGNTKHGSELHGRRGCLFVNSPDFSYFRIRQLATPVFHSCCWIKSFFANAIQHVILGSAKKKMFSIYTFSVVALVKHAESRWNISVFYGPRKPMCPDNLLSIPSHAISKFIYIGRPVPASSDAWSVFREISKFINMVKEFFNMSIIHVRSIQC
jgi:hypothetical protein